MRNRVFGFGAAVIGLAAYWFFASPSQSPHMAQQPSAGPGAPMVAVNLPTLSAAAERGRIAFEANCAACHGTNAAGQQGVAPPLIHKIYEPSHHGDAAFVLAAKNGVRAHQWDFGDMPAVPGVTDQDIVDIIVYVRQLQQANGIDVSGLN